MNENKNIEYISIHNLSPHPKNPHNGIGDLTELAVCRGMIRRQKDNERNKITN